MYSLNEQQQKRLAEIKTQLTEDAFNFLNTKVERLKTFANAEERINNLINKDVPAIKRVISTQKSKAKKVQIEEIIPDEYISEICNVAKSFDYYHVCQLIKKLENIKEANKQKFVTELDNKIKKAEDEIKALQELKSNL